jgi:hypothetical protein
VNRVLVALEIGDRPLELREPGIQIWPPVRQIAELRCLGGDLLRQPLLRSDDRIRTSVGIEFHTIQVLSESRIHGCQEVTAIGGFLPSFQIEREVDLWVGGWIGTGEI